MLSRLIHLATSSRGAHQLLLSAQSHVCVVASSYKACVGDGREVFSLSWNAPSPRPSPRRVTGWQSVHGHWTVGDTGAGETLWRWAGGCRYTLVLLPEQSGGEEHKWHWGEEVRNIILKCTDKSACASTDRAASNTWCFLYKQISPLPPTKAGTYRQLSPLNARKLASRNPKTQSRSENAHIPKTANRPVLRITWDRATWGHSHLVKFYYLCICLAQYSIAPFDVNCGCCSHREKNRRSVALTTLRQDKEECTAKDSIWTVIYCLGWTRLCANYNSSSLIWIEVATGYRIWN